MQNTMQNTIQNQFNVLQEQLDEIRAQNTPNATPGVEETPEARANPQNHNPHPEVGVSNPAQVDPAQHAESVHIDPAEEVPMRDLPQRYNELVQMVRRRERQDEGMAQRLQTLERAIEKKDEAAEDERRALENPLAAEILSTKVPPGFVLSSLDKYAGSGDPVDHVKYFKSYAAAADLDDAVQCKVFVTTLKGAARKWFDGLPSGSITSFKELNRAFVRNYSTLKATRKTPDDLENITQRPNERLSDFLRQFQEEALDIDGLEEPAAMMALKRGLYHDRFKNHLKKHDVKTIEEAVRRADKFIQTSNLYRGGEGSKAERPPPREQRDMRPAKRNRPDAPLLAVPHGQSRYESYTPLNTSRANVLMHVRSRLKLRSPRPLGGDPQRRDTTKRCEFHNEYGHTTEDCHNLQQELEYWVRKGQLDEYLVRPQL